MPLLFFACNSCKRILVSSMLKIYTQYLQSDELQNGFLPIDISIKLSSKKNLRLLLWQVWISALGSCLQHWQKYTSCDKLECERAPTFSSSLDSLLHLPLASFTYAPQTLCAFAPSPQSTRLRLGRGEPLCSGLAESRRVAEPRLATQRLC